jgi:uncharacterized protein (DUF58 family)
MVAVEQYLKPELASQIKRLDLRAQMIVRGFLQGMHASPYHGFSVEFSEHRRYSHGDDPKDIDWLAYAKTDKYYVKKFESETNVTGYMMMDLSQSMGYTYRQQLTKFDYCICLAAALTYLMLMQQDPIGLITFDKKIRGNRTSSPHPAIGGHASPSVVGHDHERSIGRCSTHLGSHSDASACRPRCDRVSYSGRSGSDVSIRWFGAA